ncbi:MAG TPA: SDR family oxidoreductase [Polyangiaceae bacterium]
MPIQRQNDAFAGSWCLVTGASSGLGEEFARQLARRGAHLILTARSEERLRNLASDLARVNGVHTHVIPADLADPKGVEALLAGVRASGHFVEHVINNAGFGSSGAFARLDPERELALVRVNVEAVQRLTHGLLEPMQAAGRGGFINVASTASFQPVPFMASYGASKAFVLHFTLALAGELEGTGVRAMALCPGPVRTGFQAVAGISKPGLAMAELTSERTIARALVAYERGERLCIPGFVNGAQSVAARILPRSLLTWATVRTMKRLGRTRTPG